MVSDILFAILVVGDNGNVARMPCLSLRRARSDSIGGEALHVPEQQPPDSAVHELQLPSSEGEAVLTWLRQVSGRTRSSPVWIVTATPGAEEPTWLDGSRRRHSLARPFGSWDLVAMLENLLLTRDGSY
jgi:response regulator RpfG family c-di-GMP phosphodiesterase